VQVILVVNQIYWCQEVEEAFAKMKSDKDAMNKYNQQQVQQLTDLIQVTRTDLEKCDRQKVRLWRKICIARSTQLVACVIAWDQSALCQGNLCV